MRAQVSVAEAAPSNPFRVNLAVVRADVPDVEANVVSAVPVVSHAVSKPVEDHVGDGRVPFEEFVDMERLPSGGAMDLDIVTEVKPCVATGQSAKVMDSEALPFVEVDGDVIASVDQLKWIWSSGAAAVDGERLIREGCRRSLRASAHIGQRESDPENAQGGHSHSGARVEPPSSSGPEETFSCVRRGKPVAETVSAPVAVDQGGSDGTVDIGDQAMFELERALNLAYRDEMRDNDRELLQIIGQLWWMQASLSS